MDYDRRFPKILEELGNQVLPLKPEWVSLMAEHYSMLLHWNERLNLTRIVEEHEAAVRHYCESLLVAANLPPGARRIADVGSGGGFPGVPLAIVRPEAEVVLIESHQRKSAFLRESTRKLPNVRVIAGRAENIRERFDVVVSRAVRWQDVVATGLAPTYALLAADKNLAQVRKDTEGFTWNVVEGWPLQVGSSLMIGGAVPRET